ncbi:hypothetical protein [Pontibacter litorisediminis]|nr:hypothetical protein [Pontibacter litorisediminis]
MSHHREPFGLCQITKRRLPQHLLVPGKAIRDSVLKLIQADYP